MASPSFCTTCGRPLSADGTCATCAPQPGSEPAYAAPGAFEAPSSTAPPAIVEPAVVPAYGGSAAAGSFAYGGLPTGAPDLARYSGMWNWGAFLLCPFWLMNHGALPLGILAFVLSLVPLVNFVSSLGFGIYFGLKGNEWAAGHRAFASDAQFVAVQNAWRNWGIGLAVLGLAFGVAAIVLAGMAHTLAHGMR